MTTKLPVPSRGTPRISCVVPAYNEAANIEPLLMALTRQLRALAPQWEILVVDDGSRDATRRAGRAGPTCPACAGCGCRATSARRPR